MDSNAHVEKKSNFIVYALVIIAAVFVLAFFAFKEDSIERINVPVGEEDIIIGDKNAQVTIVEFTDFSCPYCAAAEGQNFEVINSLKSRDSSWQAPMPNIYENYVRTGKARIIVKYYRGHGTGKEAHLVGWCLYEQLPGKFEEYKKEVFAQQENTGNVEIMKEIAVSVGGDKERINQCLASKKYEPRFNSEMLEGMNAGVKGTPIFFINGIKLEGAASYSEFKKVIESELK